jgi:hypothetical protein
MHLVITVFTIDNKMLSPGMMGVEGACVFGSEMILTTERQRASLCVCSRKGCVCVPEREGGGGLLA